jgi:hypothetical protein
MFTRRIVEKNLLEIVEKRKLNLSLNDAIKKVGTFNYTKNENCISYDSFENGVFDGFINLEEINFSKNQIFTIDRFLFNGLENLLIHISLKYDEV